MMLSQLYRPKRRKKYAEKNDFRERIFFYYFKHLSFQSRKIGDAVNTYTSEKNDLYLISVRYGFQ